MLMSVAPSYQNLQRISEVFEENGKEYILVLLKSGKQKQVRWYPEKNEQLAFDARHAFGFDEAGYITLFKGDIEEVEKWAYETDPCRARYNLLFGWFLPSRLPLENLPPTIIPVRLTWKEISENNVIKDDNFIMSYIKNLLYEKNESVYQGQVNEWLERDVTVIKNVTTTTHYGETHIHTFIDNNKNIYVWMTATKNLEEGQHLRMRMKVKEHKEVQNIQQTIVYYCKVM